MKPKRDGGRADYVKIHGVTAQTGRAGPKRKKKKLLGQARGKWSMAQGGPAVPG